MIYDFFTRLDANFDNNIYNIDDYSCVFGGLHMDPNCFEIIKLSDNVCIVKTYDISNQVFLRFTLSYMCDEWYIDSVDYIYEHDNFYLIRDLLLEKDELYAEVCLVDSEGVHFAKNIAMDENGIIDFEKAGILPDITFKLNIPDFLTCNSEILDLFYKTALSAVKQQKGIVDSNDDDSRARK